MLINPCRHHVFIIETVNSSHNIGWEPLVHIFKIRSNIPIFLIIVGFDFFLVCFLRLMAQKYSQL